MSSEKMKKNEKKIQCADFQRIAEVKKYLHIATNTEFASSIGLKSSQIFTDIKNKHCSISSILAKRICAFAPEISYEWLMTGKGSMLVGDNSNQTNVGDHNSNSGNITNVDERLLDMLEKNQIERLELLSIIKNLTSK